MEETLLVVGFQQDRLAKGESLFLGSLARNLLLFELQIRLALVLALLGSRRFAGSCLRRRRSCHLHDLVARLCLTRFEDAVFQVRLLCNRHHCQNHQNFYRILRNSYFFTLIVQNLRKS